MTLHPYKEGRCLVWDITVVDTLAISHIKETSKISGSAAEKAEKIKYAKYEEILKSYHMIPIAIETFGAWGTEGMRFIKPFGTGIFLMLEHPPRNDLFPLQNIFLLHDLKFCMELIRFLVHDYSKLDNSNSDNSNS